MYRISDLLSRHGSRSSINEERDNSNSSSSDASDFRRTLRNIKVEKPIPPPPESATQEQSFSLSSLCNFNIDAVRTDTRTYSPMMPGEGAISVSTNTSSTGEPQHGSLWFTEQTPQERVKTELSPSLESRTEEIPESSQLPADTESSSSNSRKMTGVKRRRKGPRLVRISQQQRMANQRERQRYLRETAAFNTLKNKLGENYLPPEQDPMKLTRLTTLTGAIDYIRNLTELLAQDSPEHSDTSRETGNDI